MEFTTLDSQSSQGEYHTHTTLSLGKGLTNLFPLARSVNLADIRIAPQLIARQPSLAGHISYVPGPREIEPENLAWKGISVLIKIEASNELWVRQEDWQELGMRAVRERCFFWAG